jgi:hypothetical protein
MCSRHCSAYRLPIEQPSRIVEGKSSAEFAKLIQFPSEENCKMKSIFIFLIIAAAPIALQGGSGSGNAQTPNNCAADLRTAMSRMHESIFLLPKTSNADEDFVRLMIPHHQAALDMAKTQLLCGKDPQVRRLAQEIITDQQSEIELMQLWLKSHATAAPKPNISH